MINCDNKVSWIYLSWWPCENNVTGKVNILQLFTMNQLSVHIFINFQLRWRKYQKKASNLFLVSARHLNPRSHQGQPISRPRHQNYSDHRPSFSSRRHHSDTLSRWTLEIAGKELPPFEKRIPLFQKEQVAPVASKTPEKPLTKRIQPKFVKVSAWMSIL